MTEKSVSIALSPSEWRFVSELRALPSSDLKERALALFAAVIDFAREPRCAEMQADGVPCDVPDRSCEQCQHVDALLEALRRRTVEAVEQPGAPR